MIWVMRWAFSSWTLALGWVLYAVGLLTAGGLLLGGGQYAGRLSGELLGVNGIFLWPKRGEEPLGDLLDSGCTLGC